LFNQILYSINFKYKESFKEINFNHEIYMITPFGGFVEVTTQVMIKLRLHYKFYINLSALLL
jgi:hypothetical protein